MFLRGFQDNVIRAYHRYMVSVSIFFGANKTQAENDYAKVLLFEMMLANVSNEKISIWKVKQRRDLEFLRNPF
jgi:hypothetical protein